MYSFCGRVVQLPVTVYKHIHTHSHSDTRLAGSGQGYVGHSCSVKLSAVNHSSPTPPHAIGPPSHGRAMARICAIQLAAQFAALCDGATTELDYLTCTATEDDQPGTIRRIEGWGPYH